MAPFITAVYSFSLVKEDRHIVSLGLSLLRLIPVSIVRVVSALPVQRRMGRLFGCYRAEAPFGALRGFKPA